MIEEWKKIKGYPGYEVSNYGRVKSFKRNRPKILTSGKNASGHHAVIFYNKGEIKSFLVQRLVWEAFGDGRDPEKLGLVIDHIDEGKDNNRIDNFQLLTDRDNRCKSNKLRRKLPTGAYRTANGRFFSNIRIGAKTKSLGTYDTPEEAGEAYKKAKEEIMLCTRCSKNEATAKLEITPLAQPDKRMTGHLCEQCGTEVIKFLYSCTCHIKEGTSG